MKKLLSLSALCLLGLLPVGCGSSPNAPQASTQAASTSSQASAPAEKKFQGTEFKSEAGKFTVFSAVPLKEETTPVETAAGKINASQFVGAKDQKAMFSVTYADYPEKYVKDNQAEKIVEAATEAVVSKIGGTEASTKSITVGGYAGREVTATIKGTKPGEEGTMKMRFILAGNRMYQIMALGEKGHAEVPAMMNDFVESFNLTQKKAS